MRILKNLSNRYTIFKHKNERNKIICAATEISLAGVALTAVSFANPPAVVGCIGAYYSYKIAKDLENNKKENKKADFNYDFWHRVVKFLKSLFKSNKKIDSKSKIKFEEVKPEKPKAKKIKYQPLTETEMKAFRNRVIKLSNVNTSKLSGEKKQIIEGLKSKMQDVKVILDDYTVEELKDKGGVCSAVRMINRLNSPEQVASFSKDYKKLNEIEGLIEAIESRNQRRLKFSNAAKRRQEIEKVSKLAKEQNITYLEAKELANKEPVYVEAELDTAKTKRKIESKSKAKLKPELKK